MNLQMLLQILDEARHRVNTDQDPGVVARSQETVDLVLERLQIEGLTEAEARAGGKAPMIAHAPPHHEANADDEIVLQHDDRWAGRPEPKEEGPW
jgi:hypothetical protein